MSYEHVYRNEMEIKRFHQSNHESKHADSIWKQSVEPNRTDYKGKASRQVWKPVHAMILFMGMKK